MDLQKRMETKMAEISAAEVDRETLFEEFEKNRARIAESHYEVEKLKLDYLLLKREQLSSARINEDRKIILQSLDDVEKINETCISILQKKLTDADWIPREDKEELIRHEQ